MLNPPSESILPSADILNDFEFGKFVLSNLAAKRAKQLKEGAPPLVRTESNHPLTIALAEIAAGKIRAILGKDEPEIAIVDGTRSAILSDEPIPAELGLLLPALDEAEVELMAEEDHDHDAEADDELEADVNAVPSLADLLDDTETDTEPVPVESEDGTLSLSDIADQENMDEEEEVQD